MSGHDPLQRLQQLIRIEREDITTLLAYGVGIGLISLATPVAVQALVNTIAFGALLQPLFVLTLILLVLLSFSNSLVALQFYVVEMLQRRLFVRLFEQAANNLQRATLLARDEQYLPELANRFFDVVSLQKSAATLLLETLGYVLQTLIGMLLLGFYHPMLLAFDLFLIVSLYAILFLLGKGGVDSVIEQSRAKYVVAAWLECIATNPLLGRSQQGADFIASRTRQLAEDYLQACVQHFRILSRQNAGALILHTLANTLLLGMGGWMVIERQLSLGQLIAAELVVNAMVYGLTRLGKTLDNFYELIASVDKIGYLLDLPQEPSNGVAPVQADHAWQVDIQQVSLPVSSQQDLLNQFDLQLAAADSLVISRGAERGTLLEMIYGLRLPVLGRICIGNQDLRDLHLGELRDSVALVSQMEVFAGRIVDNLDIGRALPLERLRRVLDQVGLLEDIARLPDSLNTNLNFHGTPLSAEQCLRLTLARAIASEPRLILIDKTLDHIDARYLPDIMDALLASERTWTLLIVGQHPDVIARCARHAVIEKGQLRELSNQKEA